jgi:hypothetical protein
VKLPGGQSLCPAGYGYLAFARPALVYPPNYPGVLPRHAHATGCYASQQDARAAGYRLAPTPPGDVRLGPLYLAPASADVRRTCRLARDLGVPAYCPRLLPAPWIDAPETGLPDCPSPGCSFALLSLWGTYAAPSSYVGSAPGVAEVTIWTMTTRQRRLYPWLSGCSSARPISRTLFRGHPAAWYQCPIFGNDISAVLEWHVGPVGYGISANGPASLRRRLVASIAEHLTARATAGPSHPRSSA